MFFHKSKKESRAKLEHKLYLAKETPEPIFDLSDCDIKEVPQGIYSLCRVFLKESLRLDSNNLTSLSGGGSLIDLRLLKVLNISFNKFSTLPDDIGHLVNLQEFYASHNSLKMLPDTVCNLKKLQILDVSSNNLKKLPEDIGNLFSLRNLQLIHNKLRKLPTSICKAHRITNLTLDSANFEYPPEEVVERGLEAIMKYICDDTGIEYKKTEELTDVLKSVDRSATSFEADEKLFRAKIWDLETIKQNRTRQFLEIEKHNEILQRQELELATAQKFNREKLLQNIVQEQDEFDSRLAELQYEKEQDKFRLIEQLHEAEQNAYVAIEQLLAFNRQPLTFLMEFEKLEEEKLLSAANTYNMHMKKTEILEAMKSILQQETLQLDQLYQQRVEVTKSILQKETEWSNKVSELMNVRDSSKKNVVQKLLTDMELQKAALGTLLERNDARSWGLLQQVTLVESQLAALTQIELDRRKLQLDEQVNDFAQKRMELSALLMDLLEQQDIRRSEILETLKALEDNWDKQSQDYWLKQYGDLLQRTPEGVRAAQKNIDPLLGEALLMNGVIHCLPYLSKILQSDSKVMFANDETLINAGVSSRQERLHILDAFTFYEKQKSQLEKKALTESGSSTDVAQGPSAPPLHHLKFVGDSLTECIICMSEECQVIFVPCGHIICCLQCSTAVSECPLCRADIERKIKILL